VAHQALRYVRTPAAHDVVAAGQQQDVLLLFTAGNAVVIIFNLHLLFA
jgi:hypothetical protein